MKSIFFLLMTFIKKNKKMECEGVFMIYGEDNFAIKLSISNLPELDLLLKKYYKNQTELSKTELKVLEKVGRQQYFNGKQAAEFLGVSPSTFWSWTKRYDIEFLMIDGLKRYSRDTLISFMEKRGKKWKQVQEKKLRQDIFNYLLRNENRDFEKDYQAIINTILIAVNAEDLYSMTNREVHYARLVFNKIMETRALVDGGKDE